jgi:AmiR/NasT family two-component response regulator
MNQRPIGIVVIGEQADAVTAILGELGHEIVAQNAELARIGELSADDRADVALVLLTPPLQLIQDGLDSARESACPVIGLVRTEDPTYVGGPLIHGAFDLIVDRGAGDLREALDTTVRRCVDYHALHGAFGRRAAIEQATGILMAVHGITDDLALEMLRTESDQVGCELVDTAEALVRSHLLLQTLHPRPLGP